MQSWCEGIPTLQSLKAKNKDTNGIQKSRLKDVHSRTRSDIQCHADKQSCRHAAGMQSCKIKTCSTVVLILVRDAAPHSDRA
jgi:hypothetical protein